MGTWGRLVAKLKAWGADYVHFDVMDGSFVPAISFGAGICKAIRAYTDLPLDVHLMVEHPETQLRPLPKPALISSPSMWKQTAMPIGRSSRSMDWAVSRRGTQSRHAHIHGGASVTQLRNGVAHVGKPRRRRPVLHSRNLAKAAPIAAAGPKQEPKHRY